jgi:hypothetical protein
VYRVWSDGVLVKDWTEGNMADFFGMLPETGKNRTQLLRRTSAPDRCPAFSSPREGVSPASQEAGLFCRFAAQSVAMYEPISLINEIKSFLFMDGAS